ncbi:hypothetical protein BKK49_00615 [Rodentibacter rarus]|uniref:Integrase catalytic domain-containing protein n=1 Tax=Rodentibacter rarus TaxID=1908260 RepID=A0A1V3IKT8_9PAST|nr:hypothetical protein BKK50_07070 [Rodentibacter rarus]OOF43328.1 hypothetical protein BKK49_00615 [Rodentibacter rarus]
MEFYLQHNKNRSLTRKQFHLKESTLRFLITRFNHSGINEKWVTDVSEFKCVEGKLYLSPIKDLFSGEIIAYNLAPRPNFGQITGMMEQAILNLDDAPILHSDQGG